MSDAAAEDMVKKHTGKPLFVDDVAHIGYALTRTRRSKIFDVHRPRVEFYGLGAITLSDYGRSKLVEEHKKANNGKRPNLHDLVKLHAMRIDIGMAAVGGQSVILGACGDIKWFTLNNYKRQGFASEITEWD